MHSPENMSYGFLKENIEKQNRRSNFLHFETFRTNINRVPITTKFWSKYDSKVEDLDEEKFQNYIHQIEKSINETPKTKYTEPMIESHKYGWITESVFKYDARDKELMHHPHVYGDITRIGEKIAAEKVTQRSKFSGVPFKMS
ncbi:CLUMA_CG010172, isoform A [Clunio marinus]|uniref:CLUMA_CG010172, isoform A n=1 Tax=Clunio marinus TaxID=568069 RepID=A0A1J1I8L7_9DIPT|nr:CLUMA_CG010172, isoform A [Clunio marinus]